MYPLGAFPMYYLPTFFYQSPPTGPITDPLTPFGGHNTLLTLLG